MAAAARTVFVTVTTAPTNFAGALMIALLAAVAMPVTATATTATFQRIARAASRRDDGGFKLAVLVQGDRLRRGLRFGAIDLDALLDQGAQGDAIDASTQHGVNLQVTGSAGLWPAQRNFLAAAGFGIEKKQVFGTRQMGLEKRLEAVGRIDRNA